MFLPRCRVIFGIFNALLYRPFFGQTDEVPWTQGKIRHSQILSAELSPESVHMLRLEQQLKRLQPIPGINLSMFR